jgi:energy-coupling factor transport system substrate-specific component
MNWKTKEVVIVAMLAAVIGVVFTLMDAAYMPLSAVLGPIFMELTFGVYLLSAALPMYLARKPGFAVFGALVTAGVNLLLGSPYGIQLVLAGILQAIGTEAGYLIGGKYKGNYLNIGATGVLASLFVFARDYLVFGYSTIGWNVLVPQLIVRIVSAVVIGGVLVKGLTAALKATGLLKDFNCSKYARTTTG